MKKYILSAMALCSLCAVAQEQKPDTTLTRTVVVEQEYNPIIQDASKINVVPQVETPKASKRPVEYDAAMKPASRIPLGVVPNYTAIETQPAPKGGYLRLGYGTLGNLDIYGNYLFRLSDNDRLNVRVDVDGYNGDFDALEDGRKDWDAYFYRTHAGIDYTHLFNKLVLNTAGHFSLSNFNVLQGRQRFTSGDFHFGLASHHSDAPLQFRAETNVMHYERAYNDFDRSWKEFRIKTKGDVFGAINDEQTVGVAVEINNLFYSNKTDNTSAPEAEDADHTTVDLNPYFTLINDDWNIRVGAHADIAFGYGKKFYAAPDIQVAFHTSSKSILYANITGGRKTNDFRRMENICPFAQMATPLESSYEQLNGSLGFKWGTETGFHLHLFGGYQMLKNELLPALPVITGGDASTIYLTDLQFFNGDLSNFYAGTDVSYSYLNLFKIGGSFVYRDWKEKDSDEDYAFFNHALYYQPAMDMKVHADINAIPHLNCSVGYQMITHTKVDDLEKAEAYGNLYVKANYDIFSGLSVYAHVNNLLNSDHPYYWNYPNQGFSISGGVSFKF